MNLFPIFAETVKKHRLLYKNDRVLVGLSGGADSVALLHLLLQAADKYGITVGAAHINHQLRETADRDMNFCKDLCDKLGVKLDILTVDIKKAAKAQGMSEELCARNVRYDFFDSLGYDEIATAHNKNDNAETILFNFMRGAGTSGLCGIPYRRKNIIRPLLDIKKADIAEFCMESGYDFVTDETNFEEVYTRNKIRLSLIPQIENNFNENFVDTITENAELLRFDEEFLTHSAKRMFTGEIKAELLEKVEGAMLLRFIQLYYKKQTGASHNLSYSHVKKLIDLLNTNRTGSKIDLPNGFEGYISYGKLIIDKKTENVGFEYPIFPDKPLYIPEIAKTVILKSDKNGKIALSDTDALTVRSKRNGDFFYPSGMQGKKRLSDYFTDKKIPQKQRFNIPILTKGGDIVSIIGYRNDKRFADTKNGAYSIFIKEADDAE